MGATGKWIKSIVGLKKFDKPEHEKCSGKGRKWKLWRSQSGDLASWKCASRHHHPRAASEGTVASPLADNFASAMATVVRAPCKDFNLVKRQWAAIRIQTAYRALLARQALRALKGIVKIQALFRGRRVRKQAVLTLRCLQALVRVQARIRARRVRLSMEGQAVQKMLDEHRTKADLLKKAEEGWCASKGTLQDVKAKLQMRQEGACKRERAISYSLSHKQWRSNQKSNSAASHHSSTLKAQQFHNDGMGWSWLERWMAAKPWETRLMDQQTRATPPLKGSTESDSSHKSLVKVKQNNVSKRITARPLTEQPPHSWSTPSSDLCCDDTSAASSLCTSATPASAMSPTGHKAGTMGRPSYMNLTESTKAKRKTLSRLSERGGRNSVDEFNFVKRSLVLSHDDIKSSGGLSTRFDKK